jgi:peptidoglycan hydrolase CwlO-like protein
MLLRRVAPEKITVLAVSKEARVSVATIYRRQELFALIQQANPNIQRRIAEQVYQRSLHELQEELQKAKAEITVSQKDAQLTKLGAQRPQQEIIQLKKMLLAYQQQIACLEEMLTHCTCGVQSNSPSYASDKES